MSKAGWMSTVGSTTSTTTVKVTTIKGETTVYRVPSRSLIEYARSAGSPHSASDRTS